MAGEGGLLGGYGGCGCPGQGLGCAESLSGVPRLYEYQRFLQDMKTFIVYQKLALARQTAHGGNDAVAFVPTLVYHNFLKYYVYFC